MPRRAAGSIWHPAQRYATPCPLLSSPPHSHSHNPPCIHQKQLPASNDNPINPSVHCSPNTFQRCPRTCFHVHTHRNNTARSNNRLPNKATPSARFHAHASPCAPCTVYRVSCTTVQVFENHLASPTLRAILYPRYIIHTIQALPREPGKARRNGVHPSRCGAPTVDVGADTMGTVQYKTWPPFTYTQAHCRFAASYSSARMFHRCLC